MRYFIHLSYLGDNYCGWQIQPNGITIQEALENSLSTILRTPIKVTGQGRTDSGVHALSTYAHFDIPELMIETDTLVHKLNSLLSYDISIHKIIKVSADAHARFSALSRSYQYIYTTHKNPFFYTRAWHIHHNLHVDRMNDAATFLIGKHDFTSFSSAKSDTKNKICTVHQLSIAQENDFIYLDITADRFVMNMVRTIAGTLAQVGLGRIEAQSIPDLLAFKDRKKTGENAPPYGLYLKDVKYPEHIYTV